MKLVFPLFWPCPNEGRLFIDLWSCEQQTNDCLKMTVCSGFTRILVIMTKNDQNSQSQNCENVSLHTVWWMICFTVCEVNFFSHTAMLEFWIWIKSWYLLIISRNTKNNFQNYQIGWSRNEYTLKQKLLLLAFCAIKSSSVLNPLFKKQWSLSYCSSV